MHTSAAQTRANIPMAGSPCRERGSERLPVVEHLIAVSDGDRWPRNISPKYLRRINMLQQLLPPCLLKDRKTTKKANVILPSLASAENNTVPS